MLLSFFFPCFYHNLFFLFTSSGYYRICTEELHPRGEFYRRPSDAGCASSQLLSLWGPNRWIRKWGLFSLYSCKVISSLCCDVTRHRSKADGTDSKWGAEHKVLDHKVSGAQCLLQACGGRETLADKRSRHRINSSVKHMCIPQTHNVKCTPSTVEHLYTRACRCYINARTRQSFYAIYDGLYQSVWVKRVTTLQLWPHLLIANSGQFIGHWGWMARHCQSFLPKHYV